MTYVDGVIQNKQVTDGEAVIESGQSNCHCHEQDLHDCSFYSTKIYILVLNQYLIATDRTHCYCYLSSIHLHSYRIDNNKKIEIIKKY